jgi:hypothetical protein
MTLCFSRTFDVTAQNIYVAYRGYTFNTTWIDNLQQLDCGTTRNNLQRLSGRNARGMTVIGRPESRPILYATGTLTYLVRKGNDFLMLSDGLTTPGVLCSWNRAHREDQAGLEGHHS